MTQGDAVQMTAVLRHLRKHRPNWIIDYCADPGRHTAAIGLVRNTFTHEDCPPASGYDREIDIHLYDTFCAWPDRPNTRVTSCLHERFGMEWDRECAAYQINVTNDAHRKASEFLMSIWGGKQFVGIQYEGDSAQERKNLTHDQAAEIIKEVVRLGRVPLLLDWRNVSPLPNEYKGLKTVGRLACANEWGRDAQMNAAIISQCEAFVGIDSGPGKCASATRTPALICWTKLHPALFHDPCPNTTHLVPHDHREMDLLKGNVEVARFFEQNYRWWPYNEDRSRFIKHGGYRSEYVVGTLVDEVKCWLKDVLR